MLLHAVAVIMTSFHTPCTAPLPPSNPSISILSSTSFSLTWSRPSTINCRSIDGYRVSCTAPGCSSLSEELTTQTTLTLYSADVTSCNYQCCILSYNSVGSSLQRCINLRKEITLYHVRVNSQLLFSILQLFQVHPLMCRELSRTHSQSEYCGHTHQQTTSTSLNIGYPTITRKCVLHRQV